MNNIITAYPWRFVHMDTETSSRIDGKKFGFDTMAKNCHIDIVTWGVSHSIDTLPHRVNRWDARANPEMPADLKELLTADDTFFIAFNASFDSTVIQFTTGQELAGRWGDSGVYASMYGYSVTTLKDTAKVMRLHYQKKELLKDVMKLFSGDVLYRDAKSFNGRNLYVPAGRQPAQTSPERLAVLATANPPPGMEIDWAYYDELRAEYLDYAEFDTWTSAEMWCVSALRGEVFPFAQYNAATRMNKVGIGVDAPMLHRMIALSDALKEYSKQRLREICNAPYEVANHPGFAKWLTDVIPTWGGGSRKDDILQLAAEYPKDHPIHVACYLKVAATGTAGAKYAKILALANPDTRRLYDHTRFAASARTGRDSGAGAQMLNMPRPHTKKNVLESAEDVHRMSFWTAEQWIEEFGDMAAVAVAKSVRAVFTFADGYKGVDADYSSIENYMATQITGDWESVRIIKEGLDPYIVMATKIFEKTYEYVVADKKAGGNLRSIAKVPVLGCTYGMSARSLMDFGKSMGMYLSFADASKMVKVWRDTFKGMVLAWGVLERAFKHILFMPEGTHYDVRAVLPGLPVILERTKSAIITRLPSGRGLHYPMPKWEAVEIPLRDKATGEVVGTTTKQSMTYLDNEGGKQTRVSTHGGKLLGNMCQSIAADLFHEWRVNLTRHLPDYGAAIVLGVHDQLLSEVPEYNVEPVKEVYKLCIPANYNPGHWSAGWGVKASIDVVGRFWKD